jgi:hypothetical protein
LRHFRLLRLLERCGALDETVIGDLVEQVYQGRSSLWLWRQVWASVVINLFQKLFQGRDPMKRMAASMLLLLGVFLFGFWVGRTPLFVTGDPPPRLDEIRRPSRYLERVLIRREHYGTIEFLQSELNRARVEALRESTAESKQRVADLEKKLDAAWSFQRK